MSLLSPQGIVGVVDFYVQSKIDVSFRNYTGGLIDRHVNFLGRTFWRAWFDLDRVALEPGRRDYLEYRFGTVLMVSSRNYTLGSIPYYIWLGCHKGRFSVADTHSDIAHYIDSLVTEAPWTGNTALTCSTLPQVRSKAFDAAAQNLASNLPLPSFFYQNHYWRMFYDDQLKKHTQFNDEYIYAFTWEDSRVDGHLLRLGPEDVVLAITSAGDNILAYAMQSPARIHAIDLNPTQNHLLELKVAAFTALPYEDVWKIFGEGKHPEFRSLLVSKLSPHLSSRAFQYWLSNSEVFRSRGLYDTGGSRHAIRYVRLLSFFASFILSPVVSRGRSRS
jgi:betaine lipid synthase